MLITPFQGFITKGASVASSPRFSRFNTNYSTRYSQVKRSWKQVSRSVRLVRSVDSMTEQRLAKKGTKRRGFAKGRRRTNARNEGRKRQPRWRAGLKRVGRFRNRLDRFQVCGSLFTSRTPCDAPAKHRNVPEKCADREYSTCVFAYLYIVVSVLTIVKCDEREREREGEPSGRG